MTPVEKLQALLTLAFAELETVKRDVSGHRIHADERLADACVAARRIGLPPDVDCCPERDGVDALEWCAERWREAAAGGMEYAKVLEAHLHTVQLAAQDATADAGEWKTRYLEAMRQLDAARGVVSI